MNAQRCLWAAVACLLMAVAAASAKEMTVKDVIEFKKMNFSDEEIIAEITRTNSKFNLTEEDTAALKEAKASDALIQAMKNPPRKIALADVMAMVKEGKGEEDILDAIAASPEKLKASLGEIRDMKEAKAPASVIVAAKGTPLGTGDLQMVGESGAKPAVYEKLAEILGFAKQPVTLAEAKGLMDAGVPKPIVAKLKEAGAAKPEEVAEGAGDKPKKQKEPAEDEQEQANANRYPPELIGSWSGMSISDMAGDRETWMQLRADGTYQIRIGGVGQGGKWHVNKEAGTFSMQPSPGTPESHPYKLDATKTKLTIEAATMTLVLKKQER